MATPYELFRNLTRSLYGLAVIAVDDRNVPAVEAILRTIGEPTYDVIDWVLGKDSPLFDLVEELSITHDRSLDESLWKMSARGLKKTKSAYPEVLADDSESRLPSTTASQDALIEELATCVNDLMEDSRVHFHRDKVAHAIDAGLDEIRAAAKSA